MDTGKPAIGHSEEDKEKIVVDSPVGAWSSKTNRIAGDARQDAAL